MRVLLKAIRWNKVAATWKQSTCGCSPAWGSYFCRWSNWLQLGVSIGGKESAKWNTGSRLGAGLLASLPCSPTHSLSRHPWTLSASAVTLTICPQLPITCHQAVLAGMGPWISKRSPRRSTVRPLLQLSNWAIGACPLIDKITTRMTIPWSLIIFSCKGFVQKFLLFRRLSGTSKTVCTCEMKLFYNWMLYSFWYW